MAESDTPPPKAEPPAKIPPPPPYQPDPKLITQVEALCRTQGAEIHRQAPDAP